jgi:hypothetical protein
MLYAYDENMFRAWEKLFFPFLPPLPSPFLKTESYYVAQAGVEFP